MMVDVADNQRPEDPEQRPEQSRPPALRPPTPPAAPPAQPPLPGTPVPPPTPVGPDEQERWRQFQEFQRFQEWQRSSQFGTPDAGPTEDRPPRKGKPLWRRVLLSKWSRRVLYLLVVVLVLNWAYQHYFGGPDENLPASVTGGGKTERNKVFEFSGEEAVRKVYNDIAQDLSRNACDRFATAEVEQSFADHFNAPDCETAVHRLHAQIPKRTGAVNTFAEASFLKVDRDTSAQPDPDAQVFSGCGLDTGTGPRLGQFTAEKIAGSAGGQWIITAHSRETCPTS
ncbi:hypothetical protein [Actinokineospora bangkokensis]|uniref:Uncharacterized protein n=1 Tax=Actinokineospora bangkokensis TaxID=1193682 RepID=A0A1Q9LF72_9PSEU|nr:hypothetical protein [Actinokineospora bangkokensis]OLR90664.1 hypothetical protein BJP25_29065 [Actinokineospora bangkokensis]